MGVYTVGNSYKCNAIKLLRELNLLRHPNAPAESLFMCCKRIPGMTFEMKYFHVHEYMYEKY